MSDEKPIIDPSVRRLAEKAGWDSRAAMPEGPRHEVEALLRNGPVHENAAVYEGVEGEVVSDARTLIDKVDRYRTITLHLAEGDEELLVDNTRHQTPILSPGGALEAHLRLLHWLHSEHAPSMFASLYKSADRDPRRTLEEQAAVQRLIFTAVADMAETIYVSPDMTRLNEALAEEYGEQTPLLKLTDVPVEAGLVILGGHAPSLPYLGAVGVEQDLTEFSRTRGFLFRICAPGPIQFRAGDINYSLEPAGPDSPMERLQENGGVLFYDLYDGGCYLTGPHAWEANGRPPFIPTRTCAYTFNAEEPWTPENSGPTTRRFLGTLFRLMWQRMLRPEDWRPPRPLARRAHRQRVKFIEDGSEIKVTHLRRYEPGWEDEPEKHEGPDRGPMTHSVIVKGHWREQWFRSLGPARLDDGAWNEDSHRRIWIDPHLRGEGPLIMKHSLTAVVR